MNNSKNDIVVICREERSNELALVPPPPPERPPLRLLKEGDIGPYCNLCHSSMKKNFFGFLKNGCLNETCRNYWKKSAK